MAFKFGKLGKRIEIGMYEGEIFDIRQLSCIRPNTDFQIGKLCLERVTPCLGVADMLVEINDEQRHNRLLSYSIIVLAGIGYYIQAFPGTPCNRRHTGLDLRCQRGTVVALDWPILAGIARELHRPGPLVPIYRRKVLPCPQAHSRRADRRTDTRVSNRRTRSAGCSGIPIYAPSC